LPAALDAGLRAWARQGTRPAELDAAVARYEEDRELFAPWTDRPLAHDPLADIRDRDIKLSRLRGDLSAREDALRQYKDAYERARAAYEAEAAARAEIRAAYEAEAAARAEIRAAYEAEAASREQVQAAYADVREAYATEAAAREARDQELEQLGQRLRQELRTLTHSRLWRLLNRLPPRSPAPDELPADPAGALERLLGLHQSLRYSVVLVLRRVLRRAS
jgi:chromosome segregation ATPase